MEIGVSTALENSGFHSEQSIESNRRLPVSLGRILTVTPTKPFMISSSTVTFHRLGEPLLVVYGPVQSARADFLSA